VEIISFLHSISSHSPSISYPLFFSLPPLLSSLSLPSFPCCIIYSHAACIYCSCSYDFVVFYDWCDFSLEVHFCNDKYRHILGCRGTRFELWPIYLLYLPAVKLGNHLATPTPQRFATPHPDTFLCTTTCRVLLSHPTAPADVKAGSNNHGLEEDPLLSTGKRYGQTVYIL
jgi:hypothetical protein